MIGSHSSRARSFSTCAGIDLESLYFSDFEADSDAIFTNFDDIFVIFVFTNGAIEIAGKEFDRHLAARPPFAKSVRRRVAERDCPYRDYHDTIMIKPMPCSVSR